MNEKNTPIKVIVGIIVVAFAVFGLWSLNDQAAEAPINTNPEVPGTPNEESPAATNRKYKDGTYSATGNYTSPAGAEEIFITLTIKDDVVTSASFEGRAENPGSVTMQNAFKAGFQSEVVGKSVDSINLTVVNGSSLTPKGFADALVKIKTEARV